MSTPVSVIIPTYNRAYILSNAIDSVLAQTYPHFELLIVDDGSTDNTEELVRGYSDERIKWLPLPENGGVARARNFGVLHSSHDLIAFNDSDDRWHEDKLEKQVAAMESHPGVAFSYHCIRYKIDERSSFIIPDKKVPLSKKSGKIFEQLLWDNLVGMPTLMVKKEAWNEVGGLDDSLKALEDYDLALRLARDYEALFLDEILLESTMSPGSVSVNAKNYLTASCLLINKYKSDYLATNTLSHRMEIILKDAEKSGLLEPIGALLEAILRS